MAANLTFKHIRVLLNDKMLTLLGETATHPWTASEPLPPSLQTLLRIGFEKTERGLQQPGTSHQGEFSSKTEFEFYTTKTYITDYLGDRESLDLMQLARLGVTFAFLLEKTLRENHSAPPMRIYVFCQEEDEYAGRDCCVQFHELRLNEPAPCSDDNILDPRFGNPTLVLEAI